MNQIWPPDEDMKGCTCTPLANDPYCKVHQVVPYGEKPLSWKAAADTVFTQMVVFMLKATALVVLACLCARLIGWAIG